MRYSAPLFDTNYLHIAKLNGRICGAKRSHSVSEQPNCYQSVYSNPYNDSSHLRDGEYIILRRIMFGLQGKRLFLGNYTFAILQFIMIDSK